MDFKDLLVKAGYDLDRVIVMRHTPTESTLRKVLPWLAAERSEVFNAYQQCQSPAAGALMRADFVASFIGQGDKAVFVGFIVGATTAPSTANSSGRYQSSKS